jgi:hypothetical protein
MPVYRTKKPGEVLFLADGGNGVGYYVLIGRQLESRQLDLGALRSEFGPWE